MKSNFLRNFTYSHKGETRADRRHAARFAKRKGNKKSYFVMPDEVIEKYSSREISAVDVKIYAALCSLRRGRDSVCVTQKRLALMCGISEKTTGVSVQRLYNSGLIPQIVTYSSGRAKPKYKKETYIYILKPLPKSGFFFCPRNVFYCYNLSSKMFSVYVFMCKSQSLEYEKSWNSYNDICAKLGFGKCQRSEVMKLINALVALGLIKKTVRRIKKVFVDNIYRVVGFAEITAQTSKIIQKETRPAVNGTHFTQWNFKGYEKALNSTLIIPPFRENVKPFYQQINIFYDFKTTR